MSTILNNTLVHVFGLRRSGNHLITNMLIKNAFGKKIVFYHNNVYDPNAHPPRLVRPTTVSIPKTKNTVILLSYENINLSKLNGLPTLRYEKKIIDTTDRKRILILRDPYNFFASWLQMLDNIKAKGKDPNVFLNIETQLVKKVWLSYAREFTGETHFLGKNLIPISFNDWVSTKKYRAEILKKYFGTSKNMDIGLDEVMGYGGGSSFDGTSFSKKNKKMRVLDRWQKFLDDKRFKLYVIDPEIKSFAKNIFHMSI